MSTLYGYLDELMSNRDTVDPVGAQCCIEVTISKISTKLKLFPITLFLYWADR